MNDPIIFTNDLEHLCIRHKERELAKEVTSLKECRNLRERELEDFHQLRCIEDRLNHYSISLKPFKFEEFRIWFDKAFFISYKEEKFWSSKTLVKKTECLNPEDGYLFSVPHVVSVLRKAWPEIEDRIKSALLKEERPKRKKRYGLNEKQKLEVMEEHNYTLFLSICQRLGRNLWFYDNYIEIPKDSFLIQTPRAHYEKDIARDTALLKKKLKGPSIAKRVEQDVSLTKSLEDMGVI